MDNTRFLQVSVLFSLCGPILASTVQTLTAVEGGNVTFWKGLNGKTHAILTDSHRKILLNSDNGLEQRRANNIYVENGSIIMTNVHQNDSDVTYTLQLYNPVEVTYSFKLYITKRQHQVNDTTAQPPQPSDPPKTNADHTVIYVTVGLIVAAAVAVAVAVIMYCQRESLRNRINRICRRDLTNGSYRGPTSQQVTENTAV